MDSLQEYSYPNGPDHLDHPGTVLHVTVSLHRSEWLIRLNRASLPSEWKGHAICPSHLSAEWPLLYFHYVSIGIGIWFTPRFSTDRENMKCSSILSFSSPRFYLCCISTVNSINVVGKSCPLLITSGVLDIPFPLIGSRICTQKARYTSWMPSLMLWQTRSCMIQHNKLKWLKP